MDLQSNRSRFTIHRSLKRGEKKRTCEPVHLEKAGLHWSPFLQVNCKPVAIHLKKTMKNFRSLFNIISK